MEEPSESGLPLGYIPQPVTYLDAVSLEAGIPNVARIYDALLGGKDNFAVDREAAKGLLRVLPNAARAARDNRAFLRRAVHYLAAEEGITQFLDIGTGLPTQGNVHEVAQEASPHAKVIYVDNDLVVLSHARAILADSPGVTVTEGDLRYPRELLTQRVVKQALDFEQPIAVLMIAVLHFIQDMQSPWQAVEAIVNRIPPGSFIVISHVTSDNMSASDLRQAQQIYSETTAQGDARSYPAILRFFSGTELVHPGLVDVSAWRSGRTVPASDSSLFYAGIGRKPAPR
jgi:hypothetical protein